MSGLVTNVGIELTDKDRAAAEKVERQLGVIDLINREAKELGPGSTGAPMAAGAQIVASHAQLADQDEFQVERRPTLSPRWIKDPDRGVLVEKVYTGAEYDALMAGHYCVWCDDLQADVVPLRSELFVPGWDEAVCVPATRGGGCGRPRRQYGFRVRSLN